MRGYFEKKKMTHKMNLAPRPFELIKSGKKTVEMRLNDEKRRVIKVGDEIAFTHNESGEVLFAEVTALYPFGSFSELYSAFNPEALGYAKGEISSPSDMNEYYTEEQQEKYGVLGIGIKVK